MSGSKESNVACLEAARERRVADVDDGYTRLANTLLEALASVELSGRQFRVLLAVIRLTYGYRKKADWLSAGQIAEAMNYTGSITNVRTDVRSLKGRKLLRTDGRSIGINPVISDWQQSKPEQIKTDLSIKGDQNQSGGRSKPIPETDQNRSGGESKTIQKQISSETHQRKKVNTKEKKEIGTKDSGAQVRTKTRGTSAPDFFPVTQAMIDWAAKNNITANLQEETEQFLDHHAARGTIFKNWQRAWQTWMRNSKRFSRPAGANNHWQQQEAAKEAERQRAMDAWVRGEGDPFSTGDVIEGEAVNREDDNGCF